MNTLTIFTPTYNRCKTLKLLYQSLIRQTSKEFDWLIIDDGSTDGTKELVSHWIEEGKVSIQYFYQINRGKSAAYNKGIYYAKGELFTCVDSDDYLVEEAVSEIVREWKVRRFENKHCIGILAYRGFSRKNSITKYSFTEKKRFITLKEAYDCGKLRGDTMLVYWTRIIKKYQFPIFKHEKFVPENFLYDLLDQEGSLCVYPKVLYIGQYLDDGYTQNMSKVLLNNPKGYLTYLKQRIDFDKRFIDKWKNNVRLIGFCIALNKRKKNGNFYMRSYYKRNPILWCLAIPVGILFYFYRYQKIIDFY